MGVPKPVPRSILIARARRGGKGPSPQAHDAHRNTVMIPYYNGPDRMIGEVEEDAIWYLNAALEYFAAYLKGEQND